MERNILRTIDEMEIDDVLCKQNITVSDVLLFAIVAGDYLRAKRRRYPLATKLGNAENLLDNTTSNLREGQRPRIKDEIFKMVLIEDRYFIEAYFESPSYLFNYEREYIEDA